MVTLLDVQEKDRTGCVGPRNQLVPVGISFVKDRVLQTVSPALAGMLGYRPDELRGRSAAILYPNRMEFGRVGRELYRQIEKKGFAAMNTRWVRKDGCEFECYLKACRIDGEKARDGLVVAAAVDQSGRLQTEEALHSEQERFQILVEETPFGIARIDRRGCYRYVNPEFIRIFGYTLADIPTGQRWFEQAFPDAEYREKAVAAWVDDLKRATNNRKRHRIFQVTCKSGEEKTIQFRPATLSTGEQLVIYADITEQKQLEAQLLQSQKMEAMGALASGVAHDFNNILGAIIGYAELAQLKTPPELKQVRYSLENILKAGFRARELVKQILAFRRRSDPVAIPIGLSTIVKEVAKLLRAALPAAIDLRLEITTRDDRVLADPTQMHQLLVNLCTNAQHAMAPKGGTLRLTLESELVGTRGLPGYPELHPGVHRRLTVRDTGCGMPPEVLARVFDPYFTTKGKHFGTGLGLAVVRNIVKSCKGAIRVESEPGKGTVFSILLPAFQGQTPPADCAPGQPPGGSERILFVDDEEALADLGKRILEYLGYSVCVQTRPREALNIFSRDAHAFSLVITDMSMPHLSGEQLARRMLKIRPDIPIILCTGQTEWAPEKEMKTAGIRDVITKPLVVDEIARAIRKQLDT